MMNQRVSRRLSRGVDLILVRGKNKSKKYPVNHRHTVGGDNGAHYVSTLHVRLNEPRVAVLGRANGIEGLVLESDIRIVSRHNPMRRGS